MFSKDPINGLLRKYELVQLYTDVIPEKFQPTTTPQENRDFQRETFGNIQLPLYVILEPTEDGGFSEVDRYVEGKINNVAAFQQFLERPLAALETKRATARR